jgi:hypothetical protein
MLFEVTRAQTKFCMDAEHWHSRSRPRLPQCERFAFPWGMHSCFQKRNLAAVDVGIWQSVRSKHQHWDGGFLYLR